MESNRMKIIKLGDGICQVIFALLVGVAALAAIAVFGTAMANGSLGAAILTMFSFGGWFIAIVLAFFLVFALTEIAINSARLVQLLSTAQFLSRAAQSTTQAE
jgi:hypothetical protein